MSPAAASSACCEDGGVRLRRLIAGEGIRRPSEGARIKASFSMISPAGKVVNKDEHKEFVLGAEDVPLALDLALRQAREGDEFEVFVSPAYFQADCAMLAADEDMPLIPPAANLSCTEGEATRYRLRCRAILTGTASVSKLGESAKLEQSSKLKLQGNQCFQNGLFLKAAHRYSQGIECLASIVSEANRSAVQQLSLALHRNAAAAYLQAGVHSVAAQHARSALSANPGDGKAHVRLVKALCGLSDGQAAAKAFSCAKKEGVSLKQDLYQAVLHAKNVESSRDREVARRMTAFTDPAKGSASTRNTLQNMAYRPPRPWLKIINMGYLSVYNFIQSMAWLCIFSRAAIICLSQPSVFLSDTMQISKSTFALLGAFQSLAVLEALHAQFGFTRSKILPVLLQNGGRLLQIYLLLLRHHSLRRDCITAPLFLFWSAVEIIRYPFYLCETLSAFSASFSPPSWLVWLRYSAFYVLYPLGFSSELHLMYHGLDEASADVLHIPFPGTGQAFPLPIYHILIAGFVFMPFISYILFGNMVALRKKKLGNK